MLNLPKVGILLLSIEKYMSLVLDLVKYSLFLVTGT